MKTLFGRSWAMPSHTTFEIEPIKYFVRKYAMHSRLSVDPFAGNSRIATFTNDINRGTAADSHKDAVEYLEGLASGAHKFDLAILDPPYSPRQISECFANLGITCGMTDTQSAVLYKRVRDALIPLLTDDAVVLSFGWNTVGMGVQRGFEIAEIQLVCHGGAHNDTICMAERRLPVMQRELI